MKMPMPAGNPPLFRQGIAKSTSGGHPRRSFRGIACRLGAYALAIAALSGQGGTGTAQAARPPFTAEPPLWGAVYASRTTAGFALTVGRPNREAARREAERECRRSSSGCRLLAEFAERCTAVAQGLQQRRPARRSRTREELYVVSVAAGAGRSEAEAEAAAIDACASDGSARTCLISASACGTRKGAL